MCTQIAKQFKNGWLLGKTRDPVSWMRWDDEIRLYNKPEDRFKKLIVQNPNPNEDGYYGGINDQGVAYISTYVHTSPNQISYIRRPYIRIILEAANAKEAVEIIQAFNPRIGGNMFIADKNKCFGIEGVPDQYYIEEIKKPSVKTNHYVNLPYENLGFKSSPTFRQWSKDHAERAQELVNKANNLNDIKDILRDRENSEKKTAICTIPSEDKCFTHSAFIFDTENIKTYYCQGNPLTNEFKEYTFS